MNTSAAGTRAAKTKLPSYKVWRVHPWISACVKKQFAKTDHVENFAAMRQHGWAHSVGKGITHPSPRQKVPRLRARLLAALGWQCHPPRKV